MYYAPLGIGCYAAYLTSTFGASIAVGYLKVFIIYFTDFTTTFFNLLVNTIYLGILLKI